MTAYAEAAADAELVRRFDRSGPRYTSYPTALEFHDGVRLPQYLDHLERADAAEHDAPASLYVHIPFCERLCTFCACHVIATPHREVAVEYLDYLDREIELLTERLPRRRTLAQMHWGGGTPTYLSPAELEALFGAISRRFGFAPGAELAIEIDPRVTTRVQVETLARLGFNRLSLGVQDFTPAVQEAIGRGQGAAQTRQLMEAARALGFAAGINIDLVYGLPLQTLASFEESIDRLLELRPDRVALYSFAYVPWSRPHQKRLDAGSLPAGEEKLALQLLARRLLLGAGYRAIGIDHFALPTDELARAANEARLERNFMGYAVQETSTSLAVGVSGIGEVAGGFFQNEHRLAPYYEALDAGRLPIRRGYVLDADDRVRQFVIRRLMCNFLVAKDEVARRFGVAFDEYFAEPLAEIGALNADAGGELLVVDDAAALRVTERGKLVVRNVCMAFDRHRAERAAGRPAFSRTI